MAVLKKDELLAAFKTYVGDRSDDDTIKLTEDLADTLTSYNTDEINEKVTQLEAQMKEQDEAWRKKYIARFSEPESDETKRRTSEPKYTFESLFKEE